MLSEESRLLQDAEQGDSAAVGRLVNLHAVRIKRMIAVRMDPRLASRLDASDVYQELQLDVLRRLPEYFQKREVGFFEWLRFLGRQKLLELTRRHLLAQARDIRREVVNPLPQAASSMALAGFLIGDITSPSLQVSRREVKAQLDAAIEKMDEWDREVLLLRHAEQLTAVEAAREMNISPNTFRQRYLRALKRLKTILQEHDLRWINENG